MEVAAPVPARFPQEPSITPPVMEAKVPMDPALALAEAGELLGAGQQEKAIEFLMKAFREGSPEIRKEAIRMLEDLGEIDSM